MMTGTTPFLGKQSWLAQTPILFQQPFDLANAEMELLGGLAVLDVPFVELSYYLGAAEFVFAHE